MKKEIYGVEIDKEFKGCVYCHKEMNEENLTCCKENHFVELVQMFDGEIYERDEVVIDPKDEF